MLTYTKILLISLLLGFVHFAQAQFLPDMEHFTTDSYGGETQNWGAIQDSLGHIYIANGGEKTGILQYNGARWFQINTNDALMVSLDFGANQRLYAGGQNELGYVEADSIGRLVYHSLLHQLPDSLQNFGVIWQTHYLKGRVYFNNGGTHIFLWNEQEEDFSIVRPNNDFHRTFEVKGEIWVRDVNLGLMRLEGTSMKPLPNTKDISTAGIMGIAPMTNETVLLLALFNEVPEQTLIQYNPTSGEYSYLHKDFASKLSSFTPYHLTKLSDGGFAVSTLSNGIFILNNKARFTEHITTQEGLQDNFVIATFEDAQQGLWACLNDGISKIDWKNPIRVAKEKITFEGSIEDIISYDNQLFIATQAGVYAQIPDEENTSLNLKKNAFQEISGIRSVQCWQLKNVFGKLMVSAGERGIYQINPVTLEANRIYEHSAYKMLPFLWQERKFLLAGGRDGLILLEKFHEDNWDTLWIDYQTKAGIITGIEKSTLPNVDSALFWISLEQEDGVRYISSSMEKFLDKKFTLQTISRDTTVLKGHTYLSNLNNQILFASYDGFYTPTISNGSLLLAKEDNLPADFVHKNGRLGNSWLTLLAIDEQENLWLYGKSKSIFKCVPTGNGTLQCDSTFFNGLDIGLINDILFQGDFVYLGGQDGLAKFHRSAIHTNFDEFRTVISKVQTENNTQLFAGNYLGGKSEIKPTLSYEDNALTLAYAALYYNDKEDTYYRHRILGDRKGWSAWHKETKTVYTNLWEGDYTFQVQARNVYGKESKSASFSFVVQPPWFRTPFAYVSYLMLLVGIVSGLTYLNTLRLQKEKERLALLVAERTHEIAKQNEEIKKKNTELEVQKEEISTQADNLQQANHTIVAANAALEKSQKALEIQHNNMMASIVYAQRIQEAMLPKSQKIEDLFPASFVFFQPRNVVSGDFYWVASVQKDSGSEVCIAAVVDCTGHGVPGAFMSIMGDAFLNQIILLQKKFNPSEILQELHRNISLTLNQESSKNRDGMDVAICVIDADKQQLHFAGAKNPLVYIQDGEMHRIHGDAISVGGRSDTQNTQYTTHTVSLNKTTDVYLFTDGFQDQFGGEKGKKFMSPKFRELLFANYHRPFPKQKEILAQTLSHWMNPAEGKTYEQVDDILVFGFRIDAASSEG